MGTNTLFLFLVRAVFATRTRETRVIAANADDARQQARAEIRGAFAYLVFQE